MQGKKYTLVTISGENYNLLEDSETFSWLAHERYKVIVPLKEGHVPYLYRFNGGRRSYRNGQMRTSNWYNLIGFLKEGVDYDGDIIALTGGRSMMLGEFERLGVENNGNPFRSILTIDDLTEMKGCRPWLLKEGHTMVTAHHEILPVVADVLEGWTVE